MTRDEIRKALEGYAGRKKRPFQEWSDHEWAVQVQALNGLAILELADVLGRMIEGTGATPPAAVSSDYTQRVL